MENTSATTLYEYALLDETIEGAIDRDDLVSHELAHQWFGDLLTCRDWAHAWLNEGFATYAEVLWYEHGESPRARGLAPAPGGAAVLRGVPGRIPAADRHARVRGAVGHLRPPPLREGRLRPPPPAARARRRGLLPRAPRLRDGARARARRDARPPARVRAESGRNLEPFFDQWIFRRGPSRARGRRTRRTRRRGASRSR